MHTVSPSSRLFVALALASAVFAAGVDRACAADAKQIQRGRYVTITGNCNDCHTAGYPQSEGKVPEREWLMGSGALGFRGPWGTTYAPNLRLTVKKMTETQWVAFAKALKTRPPMPWFNLNQVSEQDLRAMYRYIRQLGPAGEPAKAFIPPDQAPSMPFVQWPSGEK